MNQAWLVTAFFFSLLLVILYVALLILRPFLEALTWAAILAIIVYPAYAWLNRALRGQATAAALIVTVMIALVILIPAFKLGGFLTEEIVQLVAIVRGLANGESAAAWKEKPWIQSLLAYWESIAAQLTSRGIDLKSAAAQAAQGASAFLVPRLSGIAQNVLVFALDTFIALFSLFFFLRDGKEFCAKIGRLLPMDPETQRHLFSSIVNSIIAVVHGCVITAMIQGLLAGLAYWALGIPFAAVWGVVTFFAALFPIGGSALVWVPASLYLFFQGDYVRGLILVGWGVGVVGMVDNFLKPLFIGSRLRMPMLILFFSIIGGMNLFGVLGLILGPVLFALLAALLDLYVREYGK
ncbi:MAG TPA: AI-2E family transporter [Candidatus Acidoferrales bacterium]|nr:AI-2E family transporter [Candidatus Acidoferrales bacterium]